MSKLPQQNKFTDFSDYGRPIAKIIANYLINTHFTPIHVTLAFIVSGLIAVFCIALEYFWAAALFLILKSILDATDGELARVKQTPSYTGRYLDSIADILLNAIIFISIWYISSANILMAVLAFVGVQLQGTLYNYYYVILRKKYDGDTTSRIFENKVPVAFKGENQQTVTILFKLYKLLYGIFDKTIYLLDPRAAYKQTFPNWFMSAISTFGLGFQLFIIALFLVIGLKDYIIPFFVAYSCMIFVFIAVRKIL